VFRRLGVFVGGFTLDAAQRVCADDDLPAHAVLDLLGGLVVQSLVQAEHQREEVRYRLLETVRQYALERLTDAEETEAASGRHRDVFLDLAERLAKEAFGPGQPRVMAALDVEASNLSTAFEHAVASDGERALRMSVALAPWWRARARYREGEDAYARALAKTQQEPSLLVTQALSARAWVIANSGHHQRAVAYGHEAVAEAKAIEDQSAVMGALLALGNAQIFGDPRGAQRTLVEARQVALEERDEWAVARSEMLIGMAAGICQDRDLHRKYTNGLPARLERLGDLETLAAHWLPVSYLTYAAADFDATRQAVERTLAAARRIDEPNLQWYALMTAAMTNRATGNAESALTDLRTLEAQAKERGLVLIPWLTLERANAEAACGDLDSAASRLEALIADEAAGTLDPYASAIAAAAEVLRLLGDERAAAYATHGLELAHSADHRWHEARNRLVLGRLAAARGEWGEAEQLHQDVLQAILEQGFRLELPSALEALAEVACGLESYDEAARILGASQRVRHTLGLVAWPAQQAEITALGERVRDAVGNDAYERAASEGSELDEADAIAWIRRARGERKRPSGGWESLTPTELDVVRHVAAGLTNPEIGARMFVSRSTVKTHLAHVYAKLSISTRAQLAAEAERRLP
jgi:DNA-binding CsgD family transcriptional regulator